MIPGLAWDPVLAGLSAIRALDLGLDLDQYFETHDGTEVPQTYYEQVEASGFDPLNREEEDMEQG